MTWKVSSYTDSAHVYMTRVPVSFLVVITKFTLCACQIVLGLLILIVMMVGLSAEAQSQSRKQPKRQSGKLTFRTSNYPGSVRKIAIELFPFVSQTVGNCFPS